MELFEYGKELVVEIFKFFDCILGMMKIISVIDFGIMLIQFGKIMDCFDKNDFDELKGLMVKIFKCGGSMIEKIFKKYQMFGGEIEKIYVEILKYKDEMMKMNYMFDEMYENNIKYYMEFEKYVVVG